MSKPGIASRHILVVDDEPSVRDAVKMLLEFDGHSVITASSGMEGLELFGQGKYDLVITDFMMPAMKGDELAVAVKARAPGQPVVMITGNAAMLKPVKNPLQAVDFVINKPFLLEDLREAIEKTT